MRGNGKDWNRNSVKHRDGRLTAFTNGQMFNIWHERKKISSAKYDNGQA